MSICNHLIGNLGYECKEISEGVSQLISPFTKGDDGELIGAYIQCLGPDRFRSSDGGDSLAHMLSHNVKLSRRRLGALERKAHQEGVRLSEIGEFCASATRDNLPQILNSILAMCIEAGHLEAAWLGAVTAKNFADLVGEFLDQTYENVERNPTIQALSGHQIEVAFGVHGESGVSYVQPAGPRAGKLSWGNVYKVSGMMNDLREIEQRRFVIIDDTAEDPGSELGAAITTLSEHASVLPYSRRADWCHELAA